MPRGPAPTTQGHEDGVDLRELFDDLQRLSSHAGDEQRLVGRVYEPVALLRGQSFAVFPGFIEVLPMKD